MTTFSRETREIIAKCFVIVAESLACVRDYCDEDNITSVDDDMSQELLASIEKFIVAIETIEDSAELREFFEELRIFAKYNLDDIRENVTENSHTIESYLCDILDLRIYLMHLFDIESIDAAEDAKYYSLYIDV